ncbi:unnamed protein product [Lampetra planeri]
MAATLLQPPPPPPSTQMSHGTLGAAGGVNEHESSSRELRRSSSRHQQQQQQQLGTGQRRRRDGAAQRREEEPQTSGEVAATREMEKSIIATVETIANLLPAPARDAAAAAAHEKNSSGGVGNITAAAGFVPVAHRSSETDALRAARECPDGPSLWGPPPQWRCWSLRRAALMDDPAWLLRAETPTA